jgi:Ca2+-binding EF-hand superfamily protein
VVEALELLVISFSDSVKEAQEDPSALFEAEDTSGNGFLDFRELAGLLLQRQPSLSATQIRFMVTLMRSWDRQDQGKMSMTDFVRAFRLTNVKVRIKGCHGYRRSNTREPAPAPDL